MNHAVNNNLQKILSISHEVKSPLDSNKEIFLPTSNRPLLSACPLGFAIVIFLLFALSVISQSSDFLRGAPLHSPRFNLL